MSLSLVADVNGALAGIPTFDSVLDRSGRRAFLENATRSEVVRDQIVAREGETHDELLIVDGGVLKMWKTMQDGRRQIIAFRVEGDVVSMHRCDTPWPTTVQAVTAATLWRIPWTVLHDVASRSPSIERFLLDLAGEEIASLHAHLLSLGRRTTEEKLASFLLDLCHPTAMQTRLNREYRLPMRRSDIADYLGLTTESVSREFSRLKRERVITMPKPSRVVVLNRPALEAIAAGAVTPETEAPRQVRAG